MYSVKEVYYTIQGEGHHTGRPAVFLRFTGCNLWSGLEKDRKNAICDFCDTDFFGTDGENGGKYSSHQKQYLSIDPPTVQLEQPKTI
jgi:organic radical activating enzyme